MEQDIKNVILAWSVRRKILLKQESIEDLAEELTRKILLGNLKLKNPSYLKELEDLEELEDLKESIDDLAMEKYLNEDKK